MKKEEKIYVDKEGYQKLLNGIEEIKEKIIQNNLGRKEAFDAGAGDGWDSPEFEEIERQDRLLSAELQRRYEDLARIVIVEKHADENLIDIGDIVQIKLAITDEDCDDLIFKLVGTVNGYNSDFQEVSVNSPLGAAVYKKTIGDKVSYSVGDRAFNVTILGKVDISLKDDINIKR